MTDSAADRAASPADASQDLPSAQEPASAQASASVHASRPAPTSLSGALSEATEKLAQADVPSPSWDAQELLAHASGIDRKALTVRLAMDPDAEVDPAVLSQFVALIERRASREPLQHLTGVAAFRRVTLAVGPGVFVPRPETELLAGWAIEIAGPLPAPRIADLCTGSGAIAKAIADEVPHGRVYAVELAPAALEWAERNLSRTGVELRAGDLREAFTDLDGSVDVVVSNPPYIPWEAWESVAQEARDHDPELALFAGSDGLDEVRAVIARAASLLRAGGWVGIEHADVQGEAVPALFAADGRWQEIRDHRDLAGRPRYTTARLAR